MYFSLDWCTPLFRELFIFFDLVYNPFAVFPWYINTQISLKTERKVASIVWIMLHSFHMNDHVISDIPNQQCSIMLWVVVSWPWKDEPIQLYYSSPRFLSSTAFANLLHEYWFVDWKDILKMPKGVIRSRKSKKDRHYCVKVPLFVGTNFRGFYKMKWSIGSWIRGFKHCKQQSMGKRYFVVYVNHKIHEN